MTIAGKINALVLSISVAAGSILTATALLREYSVTRERIINQSYNKVQSQPQLQVAIYLNDQPELQATLHDLLKSSPAIHYAIVRNQEGIALSQLQQPNTPEHSLIPFDQ